MIFEKVRIDLGQGQFGSDQILTKNGRNFSKWTVFFKMADDCPEVADIGSKVSDR